MHLERRATELRQRLAELSDPLPGALPYDNPRRLFVQKRYEGSTLLAFLCMRHPHLGRAYWQAALSAGHLRYQGRPASGNERVAGGAVVVHTEPDTVEPTVDARMELIFEDAAMIALHKPAPLPVHPCGRFNKNTVTQLLALVWPDLTPRPVHRLDTNTTGVLVLAKSRAAARDLAGQFCRHEVQKRYLAQVRGLPPARQFEIGARISSAPGAAGSRTLSDGANSQDAHTSFVRLAVSDDGHALLEARPHNGRTNQIRLHLAAANLPIVGDNVYRDDGRTRCDQEPLAASKPIHLHAWRLTLRSPDSGDLVALEAQPPPWANR